MSPQIAKKIRDSIALTHAELAYAAILKARKELSYANPTHPNSNLTEEIFRMDTIIATANKAKQYMMMQRAIDNQKPQKELFHVHHI